MPEIRPLQREDLAAVAALLRTNLQVWSGTASTVSASLLDDPWADEELPSYVAVTDDGEICGLIGWYAYKPEPGGVSRVLHVAAAEHDAGAVLGDLVAHATEAGSAAIAGRAEPHLMGSLSDRFAVLGYARTPIIHARDPQLAAELATSSALLTRLDGEAAMT